MSAINQERIKLLQTRDITLEETALVLNWLHQRNHYAKLKLQYDTENEEYLIKMIGECNKNIIKLLNL